MIRVTYTTSKYNTKYQYISFMISLLSTTITKQTIIVGSHFFWNRIRNRIRNRIWNRFLLEKNRVSVRFLCKEPESRFRFCESSFGNRILGSDSQVKYPIGSGSDTRTETGSDPNFRVPAQP